MNLVISLLYVTFLTFYNKDLSGLVLGLGCVLIVFSLFIVAYFMIKTAPLLIRKAWEGTVKFSF